MHFLDSHCHLNHITKNIHQKIQILKNAYENQVKYILTLAVEPEDFLEDLAVKKEISNLLPELKLFTAIGFYPSHHFSNTLMETLENIIKTYKPDFIGEIGIDYYRNYQPRDIQIKLFESQIYLAEKYNLPVSIHSRNSFDDIYEIVRRYKVKGIMHCFSGNKEIAKRFLDLGLYISFAGNITYKSAEELRETLKYIPLDRLLLETDSPYLIPSTLKNRQKENIPSNVVEVYKKASEIKNIHLEKLKEIIIKNWENLIDYHH